MFTRPLGTAAAFVLLATLGQVPTAAPARFGSAATSYYVSAATGSDSYDGAAPVHTSGLNGPWKTVAKVNASHFNPGDSVLFARGDVWREELVITSSGTAGSPVTFGAYGSGPAPALMGSSVVSGWDQADITARPADILSESFEGSGYEQAGWSATQGAGGFVDPDSTAAPPLAGGGSQVLAIHKEAPTYSAKAEYAFGSAQPAFYGQVNVYVAGASLSAGAPQLDLFSGIDPTNQTIFEFRVLDTGSNSRRLMGVVNTGDGGHQYVAGPDLPLDTWVSLAVKYDVARSTFDLRLNGASFQSGALTGSPASGVAVLRLGDGAHSGSYTAYFDLLQCAQAGFPTPPVPLPSNVWKAPSIAPTGVWFLDQVGAAAAWGRRVPDIHSLLQPRDWYDDGTFLLAYAATDPDGAYAAIEGSVRDACIRSVGQSYITIADLECRFASRRGIEVVGGSTCDVHGTVVHHIGCKETLDAYGIHLDQASFCHVYGNDISEVSRRGISITVDDATHGGVSHGHLVEFNTVHDTYHTGIDLQNSAGTSSGHVVRFNEVYGTSGSVGSIAMGGILAEGSVGHPTTALSVYYNLVHNTPGQGIHFVDNVRNSSIYNNTVSMTHSLWLGWAPGIVVQGAGTSAIVVKNNVAVDMKDACFFVDDAIHVTADNNLWYQSAGGNKVYAEVNGVSYRSDERNSYRADTAFDAHGEWEDPLFVAPGADLRLQAASAAVHAGADVGLTQDRDGQPVTGAPHMGSESVAGEDTVLFADPAHLAFAAVKNGTGGSLISTTPAQTVTVAFTGATPQWTAVADQLWLQVTGGLGTGAGTFDVAIVNPGNTIGGQTSLSGTVALTAPGASPIVVAVDLSGPRSRSHSRPVRPGGHSSSERCRPAGRHCGYGMGPR